MPFARRTSLETLRAEHAALSQRIECEASRLAAEMTSPDDFIAQLGPLTKQAAALNDQILAKTPRRELKARRDAIEHQLAAPDLSRIDSSSLRTELMLLDLRLEQKRREPASATSIFGILAVIALLLLLRYGFERFTG